MQRRDIFRIIGVGGYATVIGAQEGAHQHEAQGNTANEQAPSVFAPAQQGLLKAICQMIIPADAKSGGALEANAPAFINLMASENVEYHRVLSGGLLWLDARCRDQHGSTFVASSGEQQRKMLEAIAYTANGERDSSLAPGITFFALLRDLTLDAFFTSKIGIAYLDFRGNGAVAEFTGCPNPAKT